MAYFGFLARFLVVPIIVMGGVFVYEKRRGTHLPAVAIFKTRNNIRWISTGTVVLIWCISTIVLIFGSVSANYLTLILPWVLIPYMGITFPGIICGLWHKGRLHRFATYTGARTEQLNISDTQVNWVINGRDKRLKIQAQRAQGGLLYGPTRESMSDRVGETMIAEVQVQLTTINNQKEQLLFEEIGYSAGLEIHGNIDQLLAMQK